MNMLDTARTSAIIDPKTGKPVRIAKRALTQEQAAVTTSSVRNPFGEHQAAGLTPGRLARILRAAIDGDAMAYLELAEDIEERDAHYAGVLGVRKRQVAGLEKTVEAAGDDQASMDQANAVRELVARDQFDDELIDILDAIGKSYSGTEIMWETSESMWYPHQLKWRDPRFFEFDRETGEQLMLRANSGPEPLAPYKWIVHFSKMKSGLAIRGGLARSVAWSFMFKAFTQKDWAVFSEVYGQPMRIGKHHATATETEKEQLMRALRSMASDYAAIIPEGMMIELIEAKISGNHELFEKRCKWLDEQVSKIVLGATGTTDAIAGGHAVGKVHDEVRQDIEVADARQLSATINRDLIRPFIDLNYGPQKAYPKFSLGRPEQVDQAALMANVKTFVELGGGVSEAVVRDRIGLPDPSPDEKLLGIAATPPETEPTNQTDAPQAALRVAALRADQGSGHDHHHDGDALDRAIDAVTGDEWALAVAPMIDGLAEELAGAADMDDARAILARYRDQINVADMTELLARMTFAARLSGETDEDIS
ncbi:MAG: DUF935 domain-containing protein [Pseudomonadota bacterium]